jgi:hypothetical protein
MRVMQRLLAVSALGLPLLVGCSSDGDHSSRSSRTYNTSRDYRGYGTSRSYDYDRYDRAGTAGYGSSRGPWRDSDGYLHHPPGWKAASDRGRDDNDRDDPSRNGYYNNSRSYNRY